MDLTLPALEDAVWQELARAVRDRQHGWRLPVLATVDGDAADARTVVLREVEQASRTLVLFTDARSPKVGQIGEHPLGMLVMWSPHLGWQLRARVRLAVETAGLRVTSHWATLSMTPSAQDYLAPRPPGTPLDTPAPQREARGHFAIVTAEVLALDWLSLSAEGHRRARFDATGAGWLTP
jgi:pyridoxamine 5'-phosphate oxidase